MKETVKLWYTKTFPDDELGAEINENITFEDVLQALNQHTEIYEFIGVGDSIVRERIFGELAERADCDYDDIYYKWLRG